VRAGACRPITGGPRPEPSESRGGT
jgi:hypothetical protein